VHFNSLSRTLMPPHAGGLPLAAAHRVQSLRGNGDAAALRSAPDPSAQWVLAGSVSGLCLLSANVAALFAAVVGLAYPAYLSIKAIELEADREASGDAKPSDAACSATSDVKPALLTYWVCYALVLLAEGFAGFSGLQLSRAKNYHVFKVALLVWLHRKGALSLYSKCLRPMIKTNEGLVEEWVREVTEAVEGQYHEIKRRSSVALRSLGGRLVSSLRPL
jgi:hypothetical protein